MRPASEFSPDDALLDVRGLHVGFPRAGKLVEVVSDVSFSVRPGECVALVGESGSGKSVTARAILGLLDAKTSRIRGEIVVEGTDLTKLSRKHLDRIRGARVGAIFQEPMTSLNPSFTVGEQIAEIVRRHRRWNRRRAWMHAVEMLERVGIAAPALRAKEYPHNFSGGMRQRVMLAMAMATEPALLVADEPTTALDVTIQARVLRLLKDLQQAFDVSVLFITHDLSVVADVADKVVVMYAGHVMERTDVGSFFSHPQHPYSSALMKCLPQVVNERGPLHVIPGFVLPPEKWPSGCRFSDRCAHVVEGRCTDHPIAATEHRGHIVRCIRVDELELDGVLSR